jgi:hypothetical protein
MTTCLYRISYFQDDKIYEIYAKHIAESEIFSFLEVEGIVFGEVSSVLVDPSEERLRNEFADVQRTYIPTHTIIRIDQVKRQGIAKIKDAQLSSNVSHFPQPRKRTDNE